jgi:hypothetical protein
MPARAYSTAGGTVLVWEHDGLALTCVSDAASDELRAFVVRFSAAHHGNGNVFEDVAHFVLGPFGWS